MKTTKPSLWLITLIAGLPLLSETIYAPSMPSMATSYHVPESWIEYTLAIYMAGFALGVLYWGQLSDKLGRKTCLLLGFSVYVIGCIGCYFSDHYTALLLWRFIQAFGGSVGSVLGQAVARDSFEGPQLSKAYSLLGAALALFPAIGSLSGGLITTYFHWSNLFLVLMTLGFMLITTMALKLPETFEKNSNNHPKLLLLKRMIKDPKVLCYGFIVAAANGISFSYFAEGSFFFIEELNISPQWYGASFVLFASASLSGGVFSKKLLQHKSAKEVLNVGLKLVMIGAGLFVASVGLALTLGFSQHFTAALSWLSMMVIGMGICICTSNALAMALEDYRFAIGTASSFFGFGYYALIALFTYLMGILHNGTLVPMPMYFLCLGGLMMLIHARYQRLHQTQSSLIA